MTPAQKTPAQPVQTPTPAQQRPGPVPLDPQMFRHVSGGGPRGGWEMTSS